MFEAKQPDPAPAPEEPTPPIEPLEVKPAVPINPKALYPHYAFRSGKTFVEIKPNKMDKDQVELWVKYGEASVTTPMNLKLRKWGDWTETQIRNKVQDASLGDFALSDYEVTQLLLSLRDTLPKVKAVGNVSVAGVENVDILAGRAIDIVHPSMSITHREHHSTDPSVLWYGMAMDVVSDGIVVKQPILVSSNKQLLIYNDTTLKDKNIALATSFTTMPSRWSKTGISRFTVSVDSVDSVDGVSTPTQSRESSNGYTIFTPGVYTPSIPSKTKKSTFATLSTLKIDTQFPKFLADIFLKYIDFPDPRLATLLGVWVLGTYCYIIFNSYPYLYLGGVKQAGKTKVLDVVRQTSYNAIASVDMSSSSLFRICDSYRPTLLIDESESLKDPERKMDFKCILNSGYKRGSQAFRTKEGKNADNMKTFDVIGYDVYCPKIMASIMGLDDVLESRCITLIMERTINKVVGEREVDDFDPMWQEVRDYLYEWMLLNFHNIKEAYDTLDIEHDGITNRQWELWKPLVAIASIFDKDVLEEVVQLAKDTSKIMKNEDSADDNSIILLQTLRGMAAGDNYYSLKDITSSFRANFSTEEDHKWITERHVAAILKRLGFREKRRVGAGMDIRITKIKVENMCLRMGLVEGAKEETPEEVIIDSKTSEAKAKRQMEQALIEIITELEAENDKAYEADIVVRMRDDHNITDKEAIELIKQHKDKGDLLEVEPRHYMIKNRW